MKTPIGLRLDALDKAIRAAGVPTFGAALEDEKSFVVRIDFTPAATTAHVAQANAIVAAWDWSLRPEPVTLSKAEQALLDEVNTLRVALALPPKTEADVSASAEAK